MSWRRMTVGTGLLALACAGGPETRSLALTSDALTLEVNDAGVVTLDLAAPGACGVVGPDFAATFDGLALAIDSRGGTQTVTRPGGLHAGAVEDEGCSGVTFRLPLAREAAGRLELSQGTEKVSVRIAESAQVKVTAIDPAAVAAGGTVALRWDPPGWFSVSEPGGPASDGLVTEGERCPAVRDLAVRPADLGLVVTVPSGLCPGPWSLGISNRRFTRIGDCPERWACFGSPDVVENLWVPLTIAP